MRQAFVSCASRAHRSQPSWGLAGCRCTGILMRYGIWASTPEWHVARRGECAPAISAYFGDCGDIGECAPSSPAHALLLVAGRWHTSPNRRAIFKLHFHVNPAKWLFVRRAAESERAVDGESVRHADISGRNERRGQGRGTRAGSRFKRRVHSLVGRDFLSPGDFSPSPSSSKVSVIRTNDFPL